MEASTLEKSRPAAATATPVHCQHLATRHLPYHHKIPYEEDSLGASRKMMIRRRARIVAVVALLLSVCVMGTCGWVLYRAIRAWRSPTFQTVRALLLQVNAFFGKIHEVEDLDVIYRIVTWCSATGLVGGILQFFLSMRLLLAVVKDDRRLSLMWVLGRIIILFAVGGPFLCIIENGLELDLPITAFLAVTGLDFVLLIPFSWLIFMYSAQDKGDLDV